MDPPRAARLPGETLRGRGHHPPRGKPDLRRSTASLVSGPQACQRRAPTACRWRPPACKARYAGGQDGTERHGTGLTSTNGLGELLTGCRWLARLVNAPHRTSRSVVSVLATAL